MCSAGRSGRPGISIRISISASTTVGEAVDANDAHGCRAEPLASLYHFPELPLVPSTSCERFFNVPETFGSPDKLLWL